MGSVNDTLGCRYPRCWRYQSLPFAKKAKKTLGVGLVMLRLRLLALVVNVGG